MSRYLVSPEALADIDEIIEYYAEREEFDRLEKVLETIWQAVETLAHERRVRLGHLRDDLTREPLLFYTVGRYAIIYRIESEPLEVVRILHHARDLRTLLSDRAA